MKKIEDYVCSLTQAKKLKELGIEQDSLFYYSDYEGKVVGIDKDGIGRFIKTERDNYIIPRYLLPPLNHPTHEYYSAFTSQELVELTNELFPNLMWEMDFTIENNQNHTLTYFDKEMDRMSGIPILDGARSLAEFLIYLLEQRNDKTSSN